MKAPSKKQTDFLITIDVEFSIGGYFSNPKNKPVDQDRHIYCKIGNKEYGIGLIMSILEKYGFRGVFFLESEARHFFGEAILKEIANRIVERGHEVQLHVHPVYRSFIGNRNPSSNVSDHLNDYSFEDQVGIIGEGKRFLESAAGKPITAFRAGSYSSNWDTVEACRKNGIKYLSNYNLAVPNCLYMKKFPGMLAPFSLGGDLVEYPITSFKEAGGRKAWNPFQICSASSPEMQKASEWYRLQGVDCLTFITHSFELIKTKNDQFDPISPNRLHIDRLESLCAFFSKHPERFRSTTFSSGGMGEGALGSRNSAQEAAYNSTLGDVIVRYLQNVVSEKTPF